MSARLARHLTYANVVATLALCLVVGGGSAVAAATLARNSVASKHIKDRSIKKRDLAATLVGANGLQGPKGEPGPAGPAGAPGAAGKDLSFDGVRMTGLQRYPIGAQSGEIPLGTVAGAELVGKCYKGSSVFTDVYIRRTAATQGPLLVYGGTADFGYAQLGGPGNYYLVDNRHNNGFDPAASQWAITVATEDAVYDVRGLTFRQTANKTFAEPAGDACFLSQATVEKASR